ncbi:MAG: hypothetical protein U0525_01910 [Patescibacteria group bacterium]
MKNLIAIFITIFTLAGLHAFAVQAQQIYCAPNSLPRSCGGHNVCTILGNCGFIQDINCCVTTGGFPTNTPTGAPPNPPTPTNLPVFVSPTATPTTPPSYYGGVLNPWYTQNLSSTRERIERVVVDSSGEYVYIVGRQNIGDPEGWSQTSQGFVKKIKISDKTVVWTRNMGSYLGYYSGGLYDVKVDGSGVYVSGFNKWGKNLYYAKLSLVDGSLVWEKDEVVDSYWNIEKGYGLDIDNTYIFLISSTHDGTGPDTPQNTGSNAKWVVYKINKSDGAIVTTRSTQITTGDDIPRSIVLSGAYALVAGTQNGKWYVEKLNKSNLTVSRSVLSVAGEISKSAMVVDSSNLYIAGVTGNGSASKFQIEKRSISNLSLGWTYGGDVVGATQSNARLALKSTTLILSGNHTFSGSNPKDVRISYVSTSSGAATRSSVYSGVGYVGSVWYGVAAKTYLSGSLVDDSDGAVFEVDQVEYTPTPTPTIPLFPGCSPVTWTSTNNVIVSSNSFAGNTYPEWNFENGADANFISDTTIAGYAEIPSANPNYGAMWGISAVDSPTDWIDYAWFAPYYSGNDMYIMLPGRSTIPMGVANVGDRYLVQKTGTSIVFARLAYGTSDWQVMYSMEGEVSNTYEFRGRVAGYSQVYKAYAGQSCQPAPVPTKIPYPTLAPNAAIQAWYTTNLSSYPEFGHAVYPDVGGEYVYLVGRKDIGKPLGWHQSSRGFIQKIKVANKSVVWSTEMGDDLGTNNGGLYDVRVDGDYLFVTGYKWWGTDLYVAKINKSNGSIAWSKTDNLGWSWLQWKGLDFDIDSDYIYIASNTTSSDQDANMYLIKKRKSDGATVTTREVNPSNNDWDGYTNVIVEGNYIYAAGYREYDKPNWYIEKLNKSDLSLISTVTGVEGIVDMHGMVSDGVYLYIGGFQKIGGGTMWATSLKTQVHVEKRRLSDLALVWSYNTPQTDRLQGSTALALYNGEVLATANDSIDRVGWFGSSWMGNNLRFVRISADTGQELFSGLYNGVGNIGSIEKDSSGVIYLAGATANTDKTAIFRINDILNDPPAEPFGIKVTQTVNGIVKRGSPIEINVDITNDTFATQAAWAFEFLDSVPSSIIGVTWSCSVLDYGSARGDMYEFPTRCGAVTSGAGNSVQFSHSSQADPLIHPGGKLRIKINGYVSSNAPSIIQNTAKTNSYVGWPENHYYTMNFMSSPADYLTIVDSDISNNMNTLNISVNPADSPTPIVPSTSVTPSNTPYPTPTIPSQITAMCVDPTQILRLSVNGTQEYYCEDNDPSGHNLIIVKNGISEKLNSKDVVVESVTFAWSSSIGGYKLVTINFVGKSRYPDEGRASQKRNYTSTIRIKSE